MVDITLTASADLSIFGATARANRHLVNLNRISCSGPCAIQCPDDLALYTSSSHDLRDARRYIMRLVLVCLGA